MTPQGTKRMRAGDHQAMQEMYAVRIEKGDFNIIGRVTRLMQLVRMPVLGFDCFIVKAADTRGLYS